MDIDKKRENSVFPLAFGSLSVVNMTLFGLMKNSESRNELKNEIKKEIRDELRDELKTQIKQELKEELQKELAYSSPEIDNNFIELYYQDGEN